MKSEEFSNISAQLERIAAALEGIERLIQECDTPTQCKNHSRGHNTREEIEKQTTRFLK